MDALYDVRIVDGWIAVACWALGLAGCGTLVALANTPRAGLWPRAMVMSFGSLIAAGIITGAVHWLLVDIANVFPEDLPAEVLTAAGFGILGVVLLAVVLGRLGLKPRAWWRRAVACLSSAFMALLSGQAINAYFGLNLTVADLVGVSVSQVLPFEPEFERRMTTTTPLAEWARPAGLREQGEVRSVQIPAPSSGFEARTAYLYLPPAYFSPTRPELPVLLLIPGQPGNPSDWLSGGRLQAKLDRFAAEHGGVAPVAVVVDPNGSPSGNTMCMDTKLAQAESYLVRDVVPWVKAHLSVGAAREMWVAGGFSFGGTCAVQLLAKYPELFSSALGFAAEKEPALAKERAKTIDLAFDGDVAAFESELPARHFETQRRSGQLLYLAAGSRDVDFTRQARVVAEQARGSGIEVYEFSAEGEGHSWEMVEKAWPRGLELLARRWGIT